MLEVLKTIDNPDELMGEEMKRRPSHHHRDMGKRASHHQLAPNGGVKFNSIAIVKEDSSGDEESHGAHSSKPNGGEEGGHAAHGHGYNNKNVLYAGCFSFLFCFFLLKFQGYGLSCYIILLKRILQHLIYLKKKIFKF